MNATHLHLILTHFPIIGTLLGSLILLYGILSKNTSIQKLSMLLLLAMALVAIPVYLTGEGAEETVEKISGVSEQTIKAHEEMAEKAIVFMAILGVLTLVNLFVLIRSLSFAKILTYVTLIFSLLTFGIYAKTGNLGGQIRHTEISTNAVSNNHSGTIENKNEKSEDNEEDDD